MKRIFFVTMVGLLMTACQSDENNAPQPPGGQLQEELNLQPVNVDWSEISFTADEMKMTGQNNAFAFNFLRQVSKEDRNVFISPLSATLVLTMASNGAVGTTASEMGAVLGWGNFSKDAINEYCKKLAWGLQKADPASKLEIANSIWLRQDATLKTGFIQQSWDFFNANARTLDFTLPESVDTINQWCADRTNGRIKTVLNEISAQAVAYMLNAVYFNGTWTTKFNKDLSERGVFCNYDGQYVDVRMMFQENEFNHASLNDLKLLELPYGNGAFSMVILLPTGEKDINQVVQQLTPDTWDQWRNAMHPKRLELSLPSFELQYERLMNSDLQALGMNAMFDAKLADFSNMMDISIFVNLVKQNTFVSVNEDGTEAAAVTMVGFDESVAEPSTNSFIVNRPFIYLITEKKSGTILFLGKMEKMESVEVM